MYRCRTPPEPPEPPEPPYHGLVRVKMKTDLENPAIVDLMGSGSVADMASREGYLEPTDYAMALAAHLRHPKVKMSNQRERLHALAQLGGSADLATAEVLVQHLAIIEGLMHRFSFESVRVMGIPGKRPDEASERYLKAALQAQRAALGILSALKTLRDTPTAPANSASSLDETQAISLGQKSE